MNLNWTVISAVAEVIGVIAIVVSLLYLALQVRFARLAAADTSRMARSIGVREIDLVMVNNASLRQNWLKSSQLDSVYEQLGDLLNLNIEDALQVDTLCQCWMRLHWGHYKSITTPDDLQDLENLISAFYSKPPMSHSWANSPYGQAIYDADFVKFVNGAISKQGSE